jgi:integrase
LKVMATPFRALGKPHSLPSGAAVPTLDEKRKPVISNDGAAVTRAKYPGLHTLRHFSPRWCAARPQDRGLNLPLKTVQARMGHSTLGMTADTYGHLDYSSDTARVAALRHCRQET